MSNGQIIQSQVDDFVTKDEAFTSVDIANAIKTTGVWIRNREVAAWLRSDFQSDDYETSRIDVGGGRQANLYHPDFFDASNYDGQNQKAMNPDDFKALHGDNTGDVTAAVDTGDALDTDEEQDFNENSRTVCSSLGRIWIPVSIVSQLGYKPGDTIHNGHFGLLSGNNLMVHHDGRVAIQSSNVGTFADGDKIAIYVKDSKVVYEAS